jgi:hypothetical protein
MDNLRDRAFDLALAVDRKFVSIDLRRRKTASLLIAEL